LVPAGRLGAIASCRSHFCVLVRLETTVMKEDEVARWYADYGYIVMRRCLAYLADPAAAEDAMQEVFVRALDSAQSYRGEASARTWLCRIADHHCIDLLRRQRRNPVRALSEPDAGQLLELVGEDDRTLYLSTSTRAGSRSSTSWMSSRRTSWRASSGSRVARSASA
jgi:RNA polymerase sigma factor (sigma-70 family)